MTHFDRRPLRQNLDRLRPLSFDADEENEVGQGQVRHGSFRAWQNCSEGRHPDDDVTGQSRHRSFRAWQK